MHACIFYDDVAKLEKRFLHVGMCKLRVVRVPFVLRIRLRGFLCGFFSRTWTGLRSVASTASRGALGTTAIANQFASTLVTVSKRKLVKCSFYSACKVGWGFHDPL